MPPRSGARENADAGWAKVGRRPACPPERFNSVIMTGCPLSRGHGESGSKAKASAMVGEDDIIGPRRGRCRVHARALHGDIELTERRADLGKYRDELARIL